MNAAVQRLAIDFGSTNTVAVLVSGDAGVAPVLFDGRQVLPSAVFVDQNSGEIHTGDDAIHLAASDPTGLEPYPKDRIADGVVWVGGRSMPATDLVAAVLRRVISDAKVDPTTCQIILSYPERWSDLRRTLLVEAAAVAGITEPVLVSESAAAAHYCVHHQPELSAAITGDLLVVDAGAGTIDVALLATRPAPRILKLCGTDCGGADLDQVIVDLVSRWASHHDLDRWADVVADPAARQRLQGHARQAKHLLSRAPQAPVLVPSFSTATHVTRAEFEKAADDVLRRLVATAQSVAAKTDLGGIHLVGGCSRVPAIASALFTALKVHPLVDEQPEMAVAFGALMSVPPAPATNVQPPTGQSRPQPIKRSNCLLRGRTRSAGAAGSSPLLQSRQCS